MEFQRIVDIYITPVSGALILVLNLMEITLICKSRNLVASMILVLNIAISDLVVGVLIFCVDLISLLKLHYKDSAVLNLSLLVALQMRRIPCLLSIFNLLAYTIMRMLATNKPLLHRAIVTRKLAITISCAIWVTTIIILISYYCAFTFGASKETYERFGTLIYPVCSYPATVIFFCLYRVIIYDIKRGNRIISSVAYKPGVVNEETNETQKEHIDISSKIKEERRRKTEERIRRIATASILAFVCCWIPISTIHLIESTGITWPNAYMIRKLFVMLSCWNSIVNPILYMVWSRQSVRLLLCSKRSVNVLTEGQNQPIQPAVTLVDFVGTQSTNSQPVVSFN